MTWRDFTIHVMAWERNEIERQKLFRSVCYQIYVSYPKDKGVKNVSIERYWPLPDDKQPDRGEPMQTDDVLRTIKLFRGNGG